MTTTPEPVAECQPRLDLLSTSATTGEPVRVTTYRGALWAAPIEPPSKRALDQSQFGIPGAVPIMRTDTEVALVLPDSLGYAPGSPVTLAVVVAAMGLTELSSAPYLRRAVADLVEQGHVARIRLSVWANGLFRGCSYTVTAECPPESVVAS